MTDSPFQPLFGWVNDPDAVSTVLTQLPRPYFMDAAAPIEGSGKGKVALLYKALRTVRGNDLIQTQAIGDCVSHGWAKCVSVLMAVEILLRGEPEEYLADPATEPIYGGSRVEVGGGRLRGDGSIGAWAAKWVSERGGVLLRKRYGDIDLTTYSGALARNWGARGVPDELEPTAREHPVRTTSLIRTYDEARDALANGYPIPVCSNQGFRSVRDSDGFCRPSGSWPHCMAVIGLDDAHSRPGVLIDNSWGASWVSGPKRHDQPDGSFWCDADVFERMLSGHDSFAISSFEGYPAKPPDWDRLWNF